MTWYKCWINGEEVKLSGERYNEKQKYINKNKDTVHCH